MFADQWSWRGTILEVMAMQLLKKLERAMSDGDIEEVLSIASTPTWITGDGPTLGSQQLAEIRLDLVAWLTEREAISEAIELCAAILEDLEEDKTSDPFLIAAVRDRLAELFRDTGQMEAAAETWRLTVTLMEPIEGRSSDAVLWRKAQWAEALEKSGDIARAHDLRQTLKECERSRAGAVDHVRSLEKGAEPAKEGDGPFELIKVYFGTHRNRTGRTNPYDYFRGARSQSMTYGRAIVSVPIQREVGTLRRPPSWIKENRGNPAHYFVIKTIDIFGERNSFFDELREVTKATSKKETLVFVHGYNTSFASAVLRTAQLAADLELNGPPVLYSWPSKGTVLSYLMDRNETIAPYVRDLKNLIRDLVLQTGAAKVHLLAHSLGGEFLLRALEELTHDSWLSDRPTPPFAELIFAAPDIDAFDFSERMPNVASLASRATVYSSAADTALKWSEWLHGESRAGRVLFAGGVECVDTSMMPGDSIGHDVYATAAIDDLRAIVWLSLQPSRRRTLQEKRTPEGTYWVCDPDILNTTQLSAMRQAMGWARRIGLSDSIDILSKLVGSPATNAEEVERRQAHSAILEELHLLQP